jgi:hypothetical protein
MRLIKRGQNLLDRNLPSLERRRAGEKVWQNGKGMIVFLDLIGLEVSRIKLKRIPIPGLHLLLRIVG